MRYAVGHICAVNGAMMTKLDEIRGRTLALWAMLVSKEVVKRNNLPPSEVASLLVLDYAEKDLKGVVEAANAYLRRRKTTITIAATSSGGITLASKTNDPAIDEIFNYWMRKLNMRQTTQKSTQRISMIRARLREGFTVEQLKKAIDGLAASDFHIKNDYKDIRYALRNDEQVRRMANIKPEIDNVDDAWQRALRGEI